MSVPIPGSTKIRQVAVPRDQWIPVSVPALVSPELWQSAQQRINQNLQQAKRYRKRSYLLIGLLTCARCGYRYSAQTVNNRAYYYCNGNYHATVRVCTQPYFREDRLDAALWRWMRGIVAQPDQVERVLQEQAALVKEKNARLHSLIATADRAIGEQQAKQAHLRNLLEHTSLTAYESSVLQLQMIQLQKEIDAQQHDRQDFEARLAGVIYPPEYIADVKALCTCIALRGEHFTAIERREAYVLLRLTAKLAIKNGLRVAYVQCAVGRERVPVTSDVLFVTLPREVASMR